MRWRTVSQNWEAFHGLMLETWPDLDENALIALDGDRAGLVELLAETRGLTSDDAANEVAEWLEGAVPADVHMDEHHDNAGITESRRYVPPGEDPSDDDARFGDDATAERQG
ncbi:hypothetical protein GEU84_002195 [Fertoebacter nigrum]|uniref:Uncharacterized protein n=1 Tax=Fertoeibacter niger TaxID=2656921 RepID=A0A8X8GXC1_9RHOB|nr:hypothetical protein [Fertoeibacter niger]NUB43181.1 hypothetical protein [Fertoeibacter niger]